MLVATGEASVTMGRSLPSDPNLSVSVHDDCAAQLNTQLTIICSTLNLRGGTLPLAPTPALFPAPDPALVPVPSPAFAPAPTPPAAPPCPALPGPARGYIQTVMLVRKCQARVLAHYSMVGKGASSMTPSRLTSSELAWLIHRPLN